MKILITIPDLSLHGGVVGYYITLKRYFSEYIEFHIIGKRSNGNVFFSTILRFFQDIFTFQNKLKRIKYDIVHLNPSFRIKAVIRDAIFLLIAKKNKIKVIVFFHGWDKSFESNLKGLLLQLFKKIYFQADSIIVLANEIQETLQNWGYVGNIYTLSTAVDDEILKSFQNEINNKEEKNITILFLSRIIKEKGIVEAIDAFSLLNKKYSNLKFIIAGDGSYLSAMRYYVTKNNIKNISFIGHVIGNKKYDVFKRSDIYLLPSYSEGMPSSVLEAMGMGLPIITRPVGGIKDFFENGKMGFVTDSIQSKDFAYLIENLIKNPELRKKISKYNHFYASKYFSASCVVKRIEDIYRKVIEL